MIKYKKLFLCLIFTLLDLSPLFSEEITTKNQITITVENNLISLVARDANLDEVLEALSKKIIPSFKVKSLTKRLITENFKNKPLKEAIDLLVKRNYAIAYDKQTNSVKMIFILNEGSGSNKILLDESQNIIKIFPGPSTDSLSDVDEYIKKRHKCLTELQIDNNDELLKAQLSFNEYIPAPDIIAKLTDGVFISVINIGWKEMSGGYTIKEKYSSEDTINDLNLKHQHYLNDILQNKDNFIINSENEEMRQSAKDLLQNATEQLSMMNRGVMTYGIEARASIEKMKILLNDPQIKLIDLEECNTEIKDLLVKEGYKQPKFINLPLKPKNP